VDARGPKRPTAPPATILTLVLKRLSLLKRLVRDLPKQVKLTYTLLFDDRVPAVNKAAVMAALVLIVTPFVNLPEWIPVVGEMDVLALTLVATRLFIATAPREVVHEQERLIKERRSKFDEDVARGQKLAVALSHRFGGDRHEAQHSMEFVGVANGRPSAVDQDRSVVA
jgi:uncharacterized membrane protein YkvA (DUF1232 family)